MSATLTAPPAGRRLFVSDRVERRLNTGELTKARVDEYRQFLDVAERELMQHRIVRDNKYTRWFQQGLATDDELHPVQTAFLETGAVQCGFCTPGLLVAVHDLLARDSSPDDDTVREALAGNLCRCTGYEKILDAVRLAAERGRG